MENEGKISDTASIADEWKTFFAGKADRTIETGTANHVNVEVGDVVIRQRGESWYLFDLLIDGVPQTNITNVTVSITAGKMPVIQFTRLAVRKKHG